MLWLGDGLLNDHTDGHVDNLARFVGPARLAIPEPTENDPNWQVYQRAAQRADMFGRIELVRLPSPGRILHGDEVVPASYMNFYIGNASVVVPQYRSEEHTSELQSLMRISYAVFCLKKKKQ